MAENLIPTILRRKIERTRARLARVRLFEAFALPGALLFAALALVFTGAFERFAPPAQALLYLAFFPFFIIALVRGFRKYKTPDLSEGSARLDASHPDSPAEAYYDQPARITAESRPYWVKHKARLARIIAEMEPPTLSEEWRKSDPLYLRIVTPLALIAIVAANANTAMGRLSAAMDTDIGALFGADNVTVTAWVTPPDYTGAAPIFLNSVDREVAVPQGSRLTLRTQSGGRPSLQRAALGESPLTGERPTLEQASDGIWETQVGIDSSQSITLNYWGERAGWNLSAIPDEPPTVRFANEPTIGSNDELSFVWGAEDEYGVVDLQLVITPTEASGLDTSESDIAPVEMPTSNFRAGTDEAEIDLTRHKWAGAEVELVLAATDALGQTGYSDPVVMKLPEKLFLEPLARASQEIRLVVLREDEQYTTPIEDMLPVLEGEELGLGDRLESAPDGLQRAALMLDAVTYRPESYFSDLTVYFALRRAHQLLRYANETSDAEPLDDLLWAAALRAEYGTVADAERRLNAARAALERALRDGASEDEIRRLMEAFRQAAEDYIAARMAEAIMNGSPDGGQGAPSGQEMLGGNDLADMLDALQDLTETGATDAARQLLSDVTNLLNNLNFQGGGSGSGDMFGEGSEGEANDDPAPENEQRLERTLERLAEILEEQRRLNDDTLQEQFGSDPQEGQSGNQQGNTNGQSGAGETGAPVTGSDGTENGSAGSETGEEQGNGGIGAGGDLSDRQETIARQLRAFRELEDTDDSLGTTDNGDNNLDIARQALDLAEDALREGDLGAAQRYQDRAIREMRDAAGQISESLDDMRRDRLGDRGQGGETDPLGRAGSTGQQNNGSAVQIPDEIERQRARDILDELRERLNRSTDPEEREYLERLLDRF